MCSIAMPGELILGHGPPVYGRRLLYRPLMVNSSGSQHQQHGNTAASSARSIPPRRIRPCLSNGSILEAKGLRRDDSIDNVVDKAARKKRVVFADDRGRPLTEVRVMSEPSNVPPLWTRDYLAGLTKGIRAEAVQSTWETRFVQPASDYLTFRRRLEEEAVSLENVIVREAEHRLVGTIKVKNLAYDKEVIVRASSDGWRSHEDVHCVYVEQARVSPSAALVLYDTFRFRLSLPANSDRLEFCVRYRVDRAEYWDNNDDQNFILEKRRESVPASSWNDVGRKSGILEGAETSVSSDETTFAAPRDSSPTTRDTRIADATRANMVTWSEFASWQHLNNDAPYW